MKRFARAAAALCLLLCLLAGGLSPAGAESTPIPVLTPTPEPTAAAEGAFVPYATPAPDGKIHYVARSLCELRVRISPSMGANYIGTYNTGDRLYLQRLGGAWCKAQYGDQTGYVYTPYITDVRHYDPDTQTVGDLAELPVASIGELYEATADFTPNFIGYAIQTAVMYEQPSTKSRFLQKIKIYEAIVCETLGDDGWGRCRYNGIIGYVQTKDMFKYDRINPYAGHIPGVTEYPLMVITKHSTNVYELTATGVKKKPIKTINPGAVLAACELDEQGRYTFAYWRTRACIKQEDVAAVIPVVPYDKAQPGDLIGIMTTYYAVGVHTLNYQGRNWNIYLAGALSSNRVLQPGEVWNQYTMIGPYRKSTGYHSAPIANPTKLTGYGGGTCQVNSTLYNLLIQLPIYVNHRKVHANSGNYYLPKGFDAAVGGGDINMIFTNTLPYPIRFQYMISDGVLTVCVFRYKE